MKLLSSITVVGFLAGPALAQESQVVVNDGERSYTVDVVSADPNARTLTIRSDAGQSTLVVSDRAMAGLQGVRPGDKVTIAVRDEATGQRRTVTAIVNGTASTGPVTTADKTLVVRGPDAPTHLVNLDPGTKKVTIVGPSGNREVFRVGDKAMLSVRDLKPGQKVLLSYRYDVDGKPEAVVRVTPAAAASTLRLDSSAGVEVVSADPSAGTITVRSDSGERTLVVSGQAAIDLRDLDLRAGETVVLGLEGDKVVVISRKR